MKTQTELYSSISTNVRFNGVSHQIKRFSISMMGLIFPQKTKSSIAKLFFKPARKKLTQNDEQWLDIAENYEIKVHGKTIQCWKWGNGPTILAVHGWNGVGTNLTSFIQPILYKGYSLVTFDAPAHGRSEGTLTNYFEITDVIRAMMKDIGNASLAGVIAHSIGAAAVINCLTKERFHPKIALIAPALKLKELLFNTFEKNGISRHIYTAIIAELEEEYGYSIEWDNPYNLLGHLDSEVIIFHDRGDRMVPYKDANTIASRRSNIILCATKGLGHKRILKDEYIVDSVSEYLTTPVFYNNSSRIKDSYQVEH